MLPNWEHFKKEEKMSYLFFDIEKATSKEGVHQICEFGYVIVDDRFHILKKGNYLINPNIEKSEWDWYVVRKVLKRRKEEYYEKPLFKDYHESIKEIIVCSNEVFGHTTKEDVQALNNDCKLYELGSIDFGFYDIRDLYKKYKNDKDYKSVTNILKELNVVGDGEEHDAEADAYNTMLILKALVAITKKSPEELFLFYEVKKDTTNNYVIQTQKDKI